jgi:electron transfer flavoprotein alpha subunit
MSAVVVCTWNARAETLSGGDEEALTIGRGVAAALGVELRLLAIGGSSDGATHAAAAHGVAAIDKLEDVALAEFAADVYVDALSQYCAARSPKVLLFNQTFDVRLVAPRLAARLRAAIVMNGVELAAETGKLCITTSAFGGDTRTVYEIADTETSIVCLNDNACQAEPAASASSPAVESVAVDLSGVTERVRVVEAAQAEGDKLEDATVIVAGGRGLGGAENYRLVEELARALGGVAGASRPIVDDGWANPSRQVGLTGKITKPALYIAAGISGASQHMVGCSAAKTIVAINTDADAAIFKHARFGIIGNCLEILPEITRAVKG